MQIGDRVAVTMYRGMRQDEDGISTGGRLVTKVGTIKRLTAHDAAVQFDDGDFQCCPAHLGDANGAFPVQRVELA